MKKCDVLLNSIRTNFSFDIYITNNLNQEFKCTVYIDIPLETENNSIYNGNITLKKDTNFIFHFSALPFCSRCMCAETGQGKRKNPIFSQYSGEGSGSVRYRK